MSLVEVKGLRKYFPVKTRLFRKPTSFVHAVDKISFHIIEGESFGLVGESGCGKTTVGNCLLRIFKPTDGAVLFDGKDISNVKPEELKSIRPKMQMVFQNPYSSLNPRKTIRDILSDPFRLSTQMRGSEIEEAVQKLLITVGLGAEHIYRYPYELSGGQRQRIAICRALAMRPKFIFLDEPTSSLDVSVQAQILNLLNDLREKFKLTYLFVTHNIDLVRYMTDSMAVMYAGKIMEMGPTDLMFNHPLHSYTQALFSANPIPDPEKKMNRIILSGEVPKLIDPPSGCRFFNRCWLAEKGLCDQQEPELLEVEKGYYVACFKVASQSL